MPGTIIIMASSNLQQLHPFADNADAFEPTLGWRPEELDAADALLQLSRGWTSSSELNSETKVDDSELESQPGKRKASDHAESSPSLRRNATVLINYAADSESDGEDDLSDGST